MEINDEMIKQSYIIAKKVFNREIEFEEGVDYLCRTYAWNDNSAKYYINAFCCMRNGGQYMRTINGTATKYYLQNIFNDYGYDALQTALKAIKEHINYYESFRHGRLEKIKLIYDVFKRIPSD
jgi:hypothetical protein